MPKQCQICGKKSTLYRRRIKLRGKYNPTPKKRRKPNLQWLRVPENVNRDKFKKHAGKRILVCTDCRKTLYKTKK
ncbi:MAG: hypothetical protein GF370_03550 [Candidatus Nealsonbacteria bacterium]|nr:hypothetical protein [Candidatus Nealsonbacteria bacterium]